MKKKRQRIERIDTTELLRSVDIVEVVERLGLTLKKAGAEFEACCPFHSERTPSFKVSRDKQIFHCFGCGAGGDAIGFAKDYLRIPFTEACEIVAGGAVPTTLGSAEPVPPPSRPRKKEAEWTPILPVPGYAPRIPREHPYRGKPLAVYAYKDADGLALGYTYRLAQSDGGKTVEPLVWARDSAGVSAWRWQSMPAPRPLYGLDRLAAKPGAPALVVEGEKCADTGHAELPSLATVSWPGGGKAVPKVDFAPLAGRRVILWADCDAKRPPLSKEEVEAGIDPKSKPLLPEAEQPGVAAMNKIADILLALEPPCDVWRVEIPRPGEVADGWDIADLVTEGVRGEALAEWIRGRSRRLARPAAGASAVDGGAACGISPTAPPDERDGGAPPFDPGAPTIVAPAFLAESSARKRFLERIEATEDFDVLVYGIAIDIECSDMRGATKHSLLKRLAKKAGVSLASLREDSVQPPDGGGREGGVPPAIFELNQIHAVVRLGGKIRIMTERTSAEDGHLSITFCGRSDFVLLYENRPDPDKREDNLGEAWLKHPARRQYEDVLFAPGRDLGAASYNLWQGFGVEPVQGEKHSRFLELVKNSICAGNALAFRYVVCWMAHLVQYPGDLPGAALVLRSGQRTGKGTFVEALGWLVGVAHYVELTNPAHLVGQFNAHLDRAILVHASEAFFAGHMVQFDGVVKGLITDRATIRERKGVDAEVGRNYKRLIVSTNKDQPLPRDHDDARLVVLDVSDAHKEDWKFFAQLRKDMEDGGYEALMHFLMHEVDLKDWHPRMIPRELRKCGADMKIASSDTFTQWWYDCLLQGWITTDGAIGAAGTRYLWPERMQRDYIRAVYTAWFKARNFNAHKYVCAESIGKLVKKFGLQKCQMGEPGDIERPGGYEFPPLEAARRKFAEHMLMDMSAWDDY